MSNRQRRRLPSDRAVAVAGEAAAGTAREKAGSLRRGGAARKCADGWAEPDAGTDTGAGTPEMRNGGRGRGRVRKILRLPGADDCGPVPPAGGCPQTAGCPAPDAPNTHHSSHYQCHFIDTDPPFPSRRCNRGRFGNVFRPRPQPNAPWDRSRASRIDRHARTTRPAAMRTGNHISKPMKTPQKAINGNRWPRPYLAATDAPASIGTRPSGSDRNPRTGRRIDPAGAGLVTAPPHGFQRPPP